jgi:predicted porin
MRGAEDLGGGNKVVFALESGFGLNSGTMQQGGRLFGRQAWVGLEGQGQRLTLGRQYTSLFDMLANFSPTSYAGQYEPVIGLLGPSLREDNMVKYRGLFGPLTAEAHWAFGGQPGAAAGSSAYGAGMDYTFGPLELAAAYDELHGPRTASGYGVARKVFAGARYGISDRTVLLGGFRYGRNDMPAVGQITRDNLWWFGVRQDVTDKISLIGALYYDNIKHATIDGVIADGDLASLPCQPPDRCHDCRGPAGKHLGDLAAGRTLAPLVDGDTAFVNLEAEVAGQLEDR